MRYFLMLILSLFVFGSISGNQAFAKDGADLYKKHCKKCHGDDGAGVEKMLKMFKLEDKGALSIIDDESKKMTDEEIEKVVREGVNKMKGYEKKLKTDENVKKVVEHVRSLQK